MPEFLHRKGTFTILLGGLLTAGLLAPRIEARQAAQPQVSTSNIPRPSNGPPISFQDSGPDTSTIRQQAELARQAMDERHKRMVADADKLLELITELKADVDKSTKFETSSAAIKKASDIEKLAHDVRDRMRN